VRIKESIKIIDSLPKPVPAIFEHLSKTTEQSQKRLKQMQLQKEKMEMAACTFKPSTNIKRNSEVPTLAGELRF
jgi:hypothetical protein